MAGNSKREGNTAELVAEPDVAQPQAAETGGSLSSEFTPLRSPLYTLADYEILDHIGGGMFGEVIWNVAIPKPA